MINARNDFPIFKSNPDLVYLDSSATSQKPRLVIDTVKNFYEKNNSNIHRGTYDLSQRATDMYEETRKKVADFIGAASASEIIFTSGTTESINVAAFGWAKKFLKKGDIIVLSEMEHHSNLVPWMRLKDEIGVELLFLKVSEVSEVSKALENISPEKIKMVSITHVSNVLGVINPVEEIISYFKEKNPDVKVLVDAAQSIPHLAIDVKKLDCDFLVFSSHKMLGPSGVGVLYAKKELLEQMDPFIFGSQMIKKVTKENVSYAEIPERFESGTRNLEGVVGLGAAIDYLQKIGMEEIAAYEKELTEYALEKFSKVENVFLFGPKTPENRIGVFSFAVGNVHAHDTAEILNRSHIAVRSGHHCAQVLMQCLKVSGTTRASFYIYNTKEDVDKLMEGIKNVKRTFKI